MLDDYTVYSLVDITDTGMNNPKGGTLEFKQAQNLNSLMQVVGMRAQPQNVRVTILEQAAMSKYEFGTSFKGKKTVWQLTFSTDVQGAWSSMDGRTTHLINDCHNVPVYTSLNEAIKLDPEIFNTKDAQLKNIYFI